MGGVGVEGGRGDLAAPDEDAVLLGGGERRVLLNGGVHCACVYCVVRCKEVNEKVKTALGGGVASGVVYK